MEIKPKKSGLLFFFKKQYIRPTLFWLFDCFLWTSKCQLGGGEYILLLFSDFYLLLIIANVQNICNLIGRKEYNIGYIVLSISILYCLAKKNHSITATGKIEIYELKTNQ